MCLSFFGSRARRAAPYLSTLAIGSLIFGLSAGAHAAPLTLAVSQQADVAAAKPAVVLHATWDSTYLYFAFQVDDTNLTGTNARPFSHPEQDDSVAVYFQTGASRPATPDSNSHAMLVSVAQGFSLLEGNPATKTLGPPVKPDYSVKFGVAVQGTLNHTGDRDKGYTITLAVPLAYLGLTPADVKPGMKLGFNAVVRSRSAKQLTSLAPGVHTEDDVAAPSNWTQLTLLAADGSGGADATGINAPAVDPKSPPPLIDGGYRDLEWPLTSRATFDSPDKPEAVIVIAPANIVDAAKPDTGLPILDYTKPMAGVQRLLMARYIPTYQADRRKTGVPQRGVFGPGDIVALPEQPATGVGPWFSSDRLTWHKNELTEMRRVGIDVALVEIGGPNTEMAAFDEKALLVLVSALRDLSARGTSAPQVALCLDMSKLAGANDPLKVDLSAAAGRDMLYAAIRRFMRLVPAEFRARVLLPSGTAGSSAGIVGGYPVFLANAGGLVTGIDAAAWPDTVRGRFAADFGRETGGSTLVFVGLGKEWSAAGGKIAAVLPTGSGKGDGAIATYAIEPGSEMGTDTQPLVSRKAGATYQASWEAAIAADPRWIVIDSWNDFTRGTEIVASRQYGPQYLDLTRVYSIQASGLKPQDVRWLDNDAPRRMFPGQVVTTTVTFQNVGMSMLRGTDGIALAYRWRRNGEVVAEGPLPLPLGSAVLPTKNVSIPIGLAAAQLDKDGHFIPLTPGDYVAEIDLVQRSPDGASKTYFSDTSVTPSLRIPITISADLADSVQFYGTTCPTVLRSGETVPVRVRLRWMGASTLGLADASLVYQIITQDGKTVVKTGTVPLPAPLPPGQWVSIPTSMQLSDATVPIPSANPELSRQSSAASGTYRVRWLLTRTQSVDAIPGEYEESVAVYPPDDAAEVLTQAGRADPVDPNAKITIDARIVNRGAKPWPASAFSVGYHWFDADGLESAWKPVITTPIDHEVKPGEDAKVAVTVTAPDHDGDYVLALDVQRNSDQSFLSTHAVTRAGDISLIPMRVKGADRQHFVDLSPFFNLDALAGQAKPTDGDIDGQGHTFPAESFPPDHFGIVAALSPTPDSEKGKLGKDITDYPSGYYYTASPTSRVSSFRFGSDDDGAKNAVVCTGQTIPVDRGRYQILHAAATATGGAERSLAIVFHYRDGTSETVTHTVADWNHLPGPLDTVAVTSHLERGKDSDSIGPCSVWHLEIAMDLTKDLVSLTLPQDPNIKIFALTLERE